MTYSQNITKLSTKLFSKPLLFALGLAAAFLLGALDAQGNETLRLFIGTYTGGKSGSEGIYTTRFNLIDGSLTEPVLAAQCENPGYLAIHPVQPRLYAVGEQGKGGALYAFTFRKSTGELKPLDSKEIPGRSACHLCLCRDPEVPLDSIVVANYSSGNVVSFPILESGKIGKIASDFVHMGSGPNSSRQKGPHPHGAFLAPDGKTLGIPDLGIDRVMLYQIDTKTAKLTRQTEPPFLSLPAGGGPRHMAWSKDGRRAYVNTEMTSTVCVFEIKGKQAEMLQEISTLPEDFDRSKSSTAAIELDSAGRFLYVSNRGHDSIAVFAVDRQDGRLTPVQYVPSGGVRPRFFTIDPSGRYLFSCNKESGNIVVFRIDRESGKLTQTDVEIKVDRPVCIVFTP